MSDEYITAETEELNSPVQPETVSDMPDPELCDSPSQLTVGTSDNTAGEDSPQSETVTEIPASEQPEAPAEEAPVEEAPAELTKKELRKQKKAEKKAKRRERRDNRVGVPVWYVILLIIGINAFWYWHIEYKYEPKVQANYDKYEAVIEEYKRQIKVQDIIWRNREEYWQKEAEQINEKADQLQANYEIIMRDLGFEIDENGNAYKPE